MHAAAAAPPVPPLTSLAGGAVVASVAHTLAVGGAQTVARARSLAARTLWHGHRATRLRNKLLGGKVIAADYEPQRSPLSRGTRWSTQDPSIRSQCTRRWCHAVHRCPCAGTCRQ